MHEVLVGNIAVGKNDRVNGMLDDQLLQVFLFEDGNAFGIGRPGQFWRVTAVGNVGNLCGGECDYLIAGVVSKYYIEIMEVSACGPKNQELSHDHAPIGDPRLTSYLRLWLPGAAVPLVTGRRD